MAIKNRNIAANNPTKSEMLRFGFEDYGSGTALADTNLYIPVPHNGRVKEIVALAGFSGGAGNSGSVTLNFYRANSSSIASATTTSLLASGGISFNSGTTVGAISTATLNTSIVTGNKGGMLVSAGTTLLINSNFTATSTVNFIQGYIRIEYDDSPKDDGK